MAARECRLERDAPWRGVCSLRRCMPTSSNREDVSPTRFVLCGVMGGGGTRFSDACTVYVRLTAQPDAANPGDNERPRDARVVGPIEMYCSLRLSNSVVGGVGRCQRRTQVLGSPFLSHTASTSCVGQPQAWGALRRLLRAFQAGRRNRSLCPVYYFRDAYGRRR